jgi:TATA-box binding protein (TBP) (component of TFIID and TFIIIB)
MSAKKENEPGPRDIQVVNIVVSTSMEHDIPLEKMAATLSNTEYNPEQFPGLVIRIKDPKTSALNLSVQEKLYAQEQEACKKFMKAWKELLKA